MPLLGSLLVLETLVIMRDLEQARRVEFTFPEACGYMEGRQNGVLLGKIELGHWLDNQEWLSCVVL